jgi:hypothetical protein
VGQLTAALAGLREALETLEAQRDHAIATGEVFGDATMKRPPSHRGRPRVPFPWLALLGGLAIACIVLLEAYTFAVPYLNMFGVDVSRLGKEWQGNPIGVVSGAGFALAASAVVFLLWYMVIRGVLSLASSWRSESPGMTGVKAVGLLLLGVLLVVFSYYMAAMRRSTGESFGALQQSQQAPEPGQTTGGEMGDGVFFLLTILVPFGAAYVLHRIGTSAIWRRRRELSTERDRWDQEERERQLARDRLVERMDLLQAKRDGIEHRRDALRAKHRALEERAQALAQQRLVALERERRDGLRFANDLFAALVQANYYFVRAARRRKAYHLIDGHSQGLVALERSNGWPFTRSPD